MQKKTPQRRCSGCGESKDKKSLIRVVRTPEGEISVDTTGKLAGRGAYICPDKVCLDKARKAKRLEKSLSTEIPEEIYLKLERQLEENV